MSQIDQKDLYPIIEKMVREEFYDLKDMALSIKVTWV